MSQDLFPSVITFIFHQAHVMMTLEWNQCTKPSPARPKDSDWGLGLHSVVANPWKLCLVLSEKLFNNLSQMNSGIVLL